MSQPTKEDRERAKDAVLIGGWARGNLSEEEETRVRRVAQLLSDERERVYEKAFALLSEAFDFSKNRPAFISRLRMMCGDYSEEDARRSLKGAEEGES